MVGIRRDNPDISYDIPTPDKIQNIPTLQNISFIPTRAWMFVLLAMRACEGAGPEPGPGAAAAAAAQRATCQSVASSACVSSEFTSLCFVSVFCGSGRACKVITILCSRCSPNLTTLTTPRIIVKGRTTNQLK